MKVFRRDHCPECGKYEVDVVKYSPNTFEMWLCFDCLYKGIRMLKAHEEQEEIVEAARMLRYR